MRSKLPEGWEEVELGEIIDLTMGQSPKSKYYNEIGEGIPFMQGNTTFGRKYPTIERYTTKTTRTAKKNDVLMSVRAPVGALNISTIHELCIGRGLCSIRMKNNMQEFIYFAMQYNMQALKSRESGTVFSSINKNDLESLPMNLPPLQEQKAIADTLSSLDDKIELNNKINKNLEEQAQAIFKHWFVDFEFPDENGNPYKSSGGEMVESELGMIPRGWKVLTLNDASILSAGGDKPEIVSEVKTDNCQIPIYSNGRSKNGLYGYTNTAKINEESVTVSARGTIGFVCLRREPFVPIVRLITLIPKIEYISAKFLYFTIKNMNILGTGTTQQQLTIPAFKTSPILIPMINIMEKYTGIINSMFDQIDSNDIENQTLAQLRDTLLPKLMSGELRIPLD